MTYQVSESIQAVLQKLTDEEKVQKALKFIEEDQENIIQKQIELTLIPAPTGHEEKKAKRLLEMFEEEGLTDCHIDPYGNAVGIRKGTGTGKTVLLEGHMDTVFPLETELKIRRENGWIYCPGIVDDTRGCASVLSVLRALNAADIQTAGDIHFVGTVQEEGMGALKGMQYYVNHHPELDASISIDGPGYEAVTYQATGIQSYEFNFYGIGGHA
ncbi:MAG: M20/M25/M40 family metallo-hydrolase, partial [Solobacterium sp.]|nr:M20/M25/M40 family metallo-hydrolase [Solobacterium sp.]